MRRIGLPHDRSARRCGIRTLHVKISVKAFVAEIDPVGIGICARDRHAVGVVCIGALVPLVTYTRAVGNGRVSDNHIVIIVVAFIDVIHPVFYRGRGARRHGRDPDRAGVKEIQVVKARNRHAQITAVVLRGIRIGGRYAVARAVGKDREPRIGRPAGESCEDLFDLKFALALRHRRPRFGGHADGNLRGAGPGDLGLVDPRPEVTDRRRIRNGGVGAGGISIALAETVGQVVGIGDRRIGVDTRGSARRRRDGPRIVRRIVLLGFKSIKMDRRIQLTQVAVFEIHGPGDVMERLAIAGVISETNPHHAGIVTRGILPRGAVPCAVDSRVIEQRQNGVCRPARQIDHQIGIIHRHSGILGIPVVFIIVDGGLPDRRIRADGCQAVNAVGIGPQIFHHGIRAGKGFIVRPGNVRPDDIVGVGDGIAEFNACFNRIPRQNDRTALRRLTGRSQFRLGGSVRDRRRDNIRRLFMEKDRAAARRVVNGNAVLDPAHEHAVITVGIVQTSVAGGYAVHRFIGIDREAAVRRGGPVQRSEQIGIVELDDSSPAACAATAGTHLLIFII